MTTRVSKAHVGTETGGCASLDHERAVSAQSDIQIAVADEFGPDAADNKRSVGPTFRSPSANR